MAHIQSLIWRAALWPLIFLPAGTVYAQTAPPASLEIARTVRPWELVSVLGTRAGILGAESGHLEAWAYPLKIVRDFHIDFLSDGQTIAGDALVRSIVVRPESTTLIYASDTFSVRETIFVPRDKPGAVIRFDIDTTQPLEIQAVFQKDLQLEWPAPLGGTSIDYVPRLHAFVLGELQGHFTAVVGSPSGHEYHEEYSTNSVSSRESSVQLGVISKGNATQKLAIAASSNNSLEAETLYSDLLKHDEEWQQHDAALYREYIEHNLKLTLPDSTLQQAYEWAEVSMLQGAIQNPLLGTGLVAGYNTSGDDGRPGYAWFFGRDAFWTSFALTAEGDLSTSRSAIEFLAKYQRADGKMPHEIAQGASFVPWFTKLPYAYASADATPLFIIAVDDYVERSGDVAFAQQMWDKLWSAYEFLLSTYDAKGMPRNAGVGHGWIEDGPLYHLNSELYQGGVSLEAVRALSRLAKLLGKQSVSDELAQSFSKKERDLDDTFWIPARGHYALGLDSANQQVDVASVLATVPMWFGLLDAERADRMITELSGPEHTTDWGLRILSAKDPHFDPQGYHWGAVWPLFTGWASVAEFRYHRPIPAFQNLETNALLTFAGASGHVAEVLSGSYYGTLQTGSPDQIWSSAMVVSPLIRGLLGLSPDAVEHTLRFAPHVPADWSWLRAEHVSVGAAQVSLDYSRTANSIILTTSSAGGPCQLVFSPAVSLRAHVRSASLDGKRIPFHLGTNADDQHIEIAIPVTEKPAKLVIAVDDDFAISEPAALPLLGETSQGVHVLSETWSNAHDTVSFQVTGSSGAAYELGVWNPRQITSVDGATLIPGDADHAKLHVVFANNLETESVTIHFASNNGTRRRGSHENP
jgi:glycogen debranching enzyme